MTGGEMDRLQPSGQIAKVKPPPIHPLQQNGVLNFYSNLLAPCAGRQLPVPLCIPESVVFENNQPSGWYCMDPSVPQLLNFHAKLPEHGRRTADGTEVEDWDDVDATLSHQPSHVTTGQLDREEQEADNASSDGEEGTEKVDTEEEDGGMTSRARSAEEDLEELRLRNQMAGLLKRLSRRTNESLDILALFIAVEDSDGRHPPGVSLDFMDKGKLRRFLDRKKPNGVLQRFIYPEGHRYSVIQAVWTPYVLVIERRQNRHIITATSVSVFHRTITSAAADKGVTAEAPIYASQQRQIEQICSGLADHLLRRDNQRVNRMVLYFCEGAEDHPSGRLHLLWASGFELTAAATPLPHYTHKLQAQVARMQELMNSGQKSSVVARVLPDERLPGNRSLSGLSLGGPPANPSTTRRTIVPSPSHRDSSPEPRSGTAPSKAGRPPLHSVPSSPQPLSISFPLRDARTPESPAFPSGATIAADTSDESISPSTAGDDAVQVKLYGPVAPVRCVRLPRVKEDNAAVSQKISRFVPRFVSPYDDAKVETYRQVKEKWRKRQRKQVPRAENQTQRNDPHQHSPPDTTDAMIAEQRRQLRAIVNLIRGATPQGVEETPQGAASQPSPQTPSEALPAEPKVHRSALTHSVSRPQQPQHAASLLATFDPPRPGSVEPQTQPRAARGTPAEVLRLRARESNWDNSTTVPRESLHLSRNEVDTTSLAAACAAHAGDGRVVRELRLLCPRCNRLAGGDQAIVPQGGLPASNKAPAPFPLPPVERIPDNRPTEPPPKQPLAPDTDATEALVDRPQREPSVRWVANQDEDRVDPDEATGRKPAVGTSAAMRLLADVSPARQQAMAVRLQCFWRMHLAKREAQQRRQERSRTGALWAPHRRGLPPTVLQQSHALNLTVSEALRRKLGRKHCSNTLDALFETTSDITRATKGPTAAVDKEKAQRRKAEAKRKEDEEEATRKQKALMSRFAEAAEQWNQLSRMRSQYVAIEAKYNNQIAIDFIEDVMYRAYSHSLNHKTGPFRFVVPKEFGNLQREIGTMLEAFGVTRDLDHEEASELEEEELDRFAREILPVEPDEPAIPAEGPVPRDMHFCIPTDGHKVVLAQLTAELETFRDFVTRIFTDQDPTMLQRLKDGVEAENQTFFAVITNLREEKRLEDAKKRQVEEQIEQERRRGIAEYHGPSRLGGASHSAALRVFAMPQNDDDTDLSL
eukprot:TRINITY_DN4469_c0_g1_i1.p1 TRINITY_DN4469_c0_g1~~TRINITY_DN4469_c0_g1_i1.p1  ORF type:complete len:1209 (-),score=181.28 TRINITY_DN4469_c0_g1_i1:10-3636(-)